MSFVIPCYGSAKTIEGVLDEIHTIMAQRPEFDYEIICVNDCSPDGVLDVLKSRVQADKHLTVADLTQNMGKASAVMAAYSLISIRERKTSCVKIKYRRRKTYIIRNRVS
jgi:undecaprenyl-phosphate 4-deoxy-4-formamido-L-arabinose transferase